MRKCWGGNAFDRWGVWGSGENDHDFVCCHLFSAFLPNSIEMWLLICTKSFDLFVCTHSKCFQLIVSMKTESSSKYHLICKELVFFDKHMVFLELCDHHSATKYLVSQALSCLDEKGVEQLVSAIPKPGQRKSGTQNPSINIPL